MQKTVVIAGFARSPFHFASKGDLSKIRPDELAEQTTANARRLFNLPSVSQGG